MKHKRRICIYSICLVVSLVFIWGLTKKTETSISNKTMDTSQEEHGSKNIDAVSYEMELSLDTVKMFNTDIKALGYKIL